MENCVIYCRISSKLQNIESQEYACKKYCNSNNMHIVEIVHESCSGRDLKKLIHLNKLLKKYNNINLLIYSLDRLCRNTVDGINIMKIIESKNINIISVSDNIELSTASGKYAFRNRMSSAEFESDLISERVRRSIKNKRENNEFIGGIPEYGYKCEIINGLKKKIKNNEEQLIIDFITFCKNKNKITNIIEKLKILHYNLNKEVDVSVKIYEGDTLIDKETYVNLTNESISSILNSHTILKRNKEWTSSSIGNICNLISNFKRKLDFSFESNKKRKF